MSKKINELLDMKLEKIGFYTLSDKRALCSSTKSPMQRCELILTDRCNFHCQYCRGLRPDCRGDMPLEFAHYVLDLWLQDNLKNIRFSGGEPTLYAGLSDLIYQARRGRVERIAISTNGSADFSIYESLFKMGVNDFSISLDACCASMGELIAGVYGNYEKVVDNIQKLSKITYVTVGVVLTNTNIDDVSKIVDFAHKLGVADIRIIPAAQEKLTVSAYNFSQDILVSHPILNYRINRLKENKPFRGLTKTDCRTCRLLYDDSVVAGKWHFPCVIYLREGGNPIGKINKNMRQERIDWLITHNSFTDPICRHNCLDVCIDYNNKANCYFQDSRRI